MIVDDHSLIRTGLRLLLKNDKEICVVAEAVNGKEALEVLSKQLIDIMILDISMPEMNGFDCIAEIKKISPTTKVIILSMHEDENYIKTAMNLGASGYIPKVSADDELFDAIYAVAKGNFYLNKNAEQSLFTALFARKDEKEEITPLEKLSPRELEVFKYIVHGHTITEIGEILQLSVKTIDTHKTKIFEKLHCQKKSELVTLALKYNLLGE